MMLNLDERSLHRSDDALFYQNARLSGILVRLLRCPFGPERKPQRAFVLLP
jgi:hypothetical protein